MKPVVFSVMDHKLNNIGWVKAGDDVQYFKNRILKVG